MEKKEVKKKRGRFVVDRSWFGVVYRSVAVPLRGQGEMRG